MKTVDWLTGSETSKNLTKNIDPALFEEIDSQYGLTLLPESMEKLVNGRKHVKNKCEDGTWQEFDLNTRVEACNMTLESIKRDWGYNFEVRSKGNMFFLYFGIGHDQEDVVEFAEKFNEDTQREYGQFAGLGSIEKTRHKKEGPEVWKLEVIQV